MNRFIKLALFIVSTTNAVPAICQTKSELNCDSIYSVEVENEMFIFYEKIAFPRGGLENFYKSLRKQLGSSKEIGKVFVQFVVDTNGIARCVRVVKTENHLLNDRAIALIKDTYFTPAEQQGKEVISTMILPIIFGPEPPQEKKKQRKD